MHDTKTDRTELMRWGGKSLSYHGVRVDSAADDVFAVIEKCKVLNP